MVMVVILEEDRTTEVNIRDNKDAVTTTLGLQWNSTEDVLAIPATSAPFEYPSTKRNVLQKIANVFDPLGLVSPFILKQRLFSKICGIEVMIGTKMSRMKWQIVFSYGSYSY